MPTRAAITLITLITLATAVGCGAREYPGPPEAQLGYGVDAYHPIGEADAVPIIRGNQGGFHIWGAVRVRYVEPQALELRFTVTLEETGELQITRIDEVDLTDTDDGLDWGQHLGTIVFLPDVHAVQGRLCRFRLDITDGHSRTASDEHLITPTLP